MKFWVELADQAIRFGCTVEAKSADDALAILRDVVARGDVVVGEEPERVAAIADRLRQTARSRSTTMAGATPSRIGGPVVPRPG